MIARCKRKDLPLLPPVAPNLSSRPLGSGRVSKLILSAIPTCSRESNFEKRIQRFSRQRIYFNQQLFPCVFVSQSKLRAVFSIKISTTQMHTPFASLAEAQAFPPRASTPRPHATRHQPRPDYGCIAVQPERAAGPGTRRGAVQCGLEPGRDR
jgi:hypothetical protein